MTSTVQFGGGGYRPVQSTSQLRLAWAELRRNRMATAGVCVFVGLVLAGVLVPLVWSVNPIAQNLDIALEPPSSEHVLGTDSFGRDIASRVIHGARLSLGVALLPVLAAVSIGLPAGLLAGYFGGLLDGILMRVVDALLSFPAILLAIAIAGVLGPSLQNVVLALTIVYTPEFARLARSGALTGATEEYVTAARVVGAGHMRIVFRHILPNTFGPLTVQVTVGFSSALIAESTLSFLGLGSAPPTPSWGLMLNEGRRYLDSAPWIAVVPGVAITLCVLAVNFVGDGLRDALDPRYRSR